VFENALVNKVSVELNLQINSILQGREEPSEFAADSSAVHWYIENLVDEW
jgi:hypothetical protein